MNKILIIIIAALLSFYPLHAQSYERAVITDMRYTLIPNAKECFDSISFPFYFRSEKFGQKICTTIERMLYNNFRISNLQYSLGVNVTCNQKNKPIKLRLKHVIDRSNKNTVYVALESSLHTTSTRYTTSTIYPRCFLTTKVTILNNKKRKVYVFSAEQSFDIYTDEDIIGSVMIGEIDFQQIFIKNIEKAFHKEYVTLGIYAAKDVIMVRKPGSAKYSEFLSNSTKYEVSMPKNTILFLNENPEGFEVIKVHSGTWRKYSVQDVARLCPKHSLKLYSGSYLFDNVILKMTYQVYKLDSTGRRIDGPGIRPTLKYLPDAVNLRIDTGYKQTGLFTYDPSGKLSGELNEISCGAEYINENDIIEIYKANSLLGLFKIYPEKRYIYYPDDLPEEDLGLLINIMHIFEYAVFLQEVIDLTPERN